MATRTRAEAFNEWMRRYTEDPEGFEREFQTVNRFLEEHNAGKAPSYGEACAAYLTLLESGEEAETLLADPPRPRKEK